MPLYFAYGSNMLEERMRVSGVAARFVCAARLPEYELAFGSDDDGVIRSMLGGSAATVRAKPGAFVWGVLWEVTAEDLQRLDLQESRLSRRSVEVETAGGVQEAEVYAMSEAMTQGEQLPSPKYVRILVAGAQRSGLPSAYVEMLERLPHNGSTARLGFELSIFD